MSLIELTGDDLARELCASLETPPTITARAARGPNFKWYSCVDYHSPLDWWVAEIGTDHGPESKDDSPVRWRPVPEITELIEPAWRVVDEMKNRGWLFHVLAMVEGFVVNARRYEFLVQGDWPTSMLSRDMVQEIGDSAPEAICRAGLAALRTVKAGAL